MPESRVVYKIASKNMKKNTITWRLKIFGTELIKEVNATYKLLFLAIIFSGLRILKIRSDFTAEILTPSGRTKPAIAEITITKSKIFQLSLRYDFFVNKNPKAMILKIASTQKAPVMK